MSPEQLFVKIITMVIALLPRDEATDAAHGIVRLAIDTANNHSLGAHKSEFYGILCDKLFGECIRIKETDYGNDTPEIHAAAMCLSSISQCVRSLTIVADPREGSGAFYNDEYAMLTHHLCEAVRRTHRWQTY